MRRFDDHRSASMGHQSIWKLLGRFAGPSIISMTTASTYNMVDAMWVGRLGSNALAALVVAFPLMLLFMSIGIGTGIGASSLISRNLGMGNRDEANHVAGNSITISVIIGLLMAAICLPIIEQILRLLGSSDLIMPEAKSYLSIIIAFSVIESFLLVIGTIIRSGGSPIFPSVVYVIASVLNMIIDPVFIFGWGPLPAMGISGAAVATVIARSIGALIFIVYLASGKSSYRFSPKCFLPSIKIIVEIYRIGFASIVRMSAASIVMALANRIAISFGEDKLAVLGVLNRIASFSFMPTIGLGQGMMPLVGYNYGAGRNDRVGEVVTKAGWLSLVWGALCAFIAIFFSRWVMSWFNSDPGFLDAGEWAMRIFALSFFSIGLQGILSSFFQGIGRGIASLVLASSRQIIFLLPALLIFTRYFGLIGLWASFPTADLCAVVLTIVWTVYEFRKLKIPFKLQYRDEQA